MECNNSANRDDRSTSMTPRALLVVAALFMGARVVDFGINCLQPNAAAAQSSINWQNMPASANAINAQAVPPRPPVAQEMAPETVEEIKNLLEASKAQHKFVIYEFYADWSDPCKKMETSALSNAQIKELIDAHYMPVRITDKFKETGGRNPRLVTDLQKKFRVFAFPTLVIVDSVGEPAATLVGNCSSLTIYRFLSRSLYSLEHTK